MMIQLGHHSRLSRPALLVREMPCFGSVSKTMFLLPIPYLSEKQSRRLVVRVTLSIRRYLKRLQNSLPAGITSHRTDEKSYRRVGPRLPEPGDPLEQFQWFKDAVSADRDGRTSKAVGILFDKFDQLLMQGDFWTVDFLLRRASTAERSLAFLMALLSITLPASGGNFLPYRRFLYIAVERRVREEGRNPDAVLGSLREWSRIDGPGPHGRQQTAD
jgi:hypothetical protein